MIDLIEELNVNDVVYVWLPSPKGFLYAEYEVVKSEYEGVHRHSAQLSLLKSFKKPRLFSKVITLKGFRLEDNEALKRPYKFYNDMTDMIKDVCKYAKNNAEKNPRLLKKLKNKHPDFF